MTRKIDWSDGADWGNHVTYAADGSWVTSVHGQEQAS